MSDVDLATPRPEGPVAIWSTELDRLRAIEAAAREVHWTDSPYIGPEDTESIAYVRLSELRALRDALDPAATEPEETQR